MAKELTYTEACARLHFYENQASYLAEKLDSEQKKSETMAAEIKELKNERNRITNLLRIAVKNMYGKSTEKICIDYCDQLSFFGDDEIKEIQLPEPEKTTVNSHTRAGKRSHDEMYGNLPADVIKYDIDEKDCEKCGSELTQIGYDSYREIEYIPAVLKIIEHRKAKYVCRECDKTGAESSFKVAAAPLPLIYHSFVSPSLLAYIINEKFCKHVPLNRTEQEFKQSGVNISRQTMSSWIITAADILQPLYNFMQKNLVFQSIIHADETPLQVNHVNGKFKPVHGYMWVYRTGRYSKKPIVLYDYRNGRAAEYPKKFLLGFSGYIHCDGLRQYDNVPETERVGCWAHLRRHFFNAFNMQHDKKDFSTIAGQGFLKIQEIFHIEGRNPEKPYEKSKYTVEQIAEIREKKSAVLVDNFFKWCVEKQGISLPKSLTGRAISYALSQKKSLRTFLKNPLLELTNNAAERAVRPVVMGRKNWLFANTEAGARAVATIFSIIETAKANLLKPYKYLNWLFDKIRAVDFNSFEDLLPWSGNLPENLRLENSNG